VININPKAQGWSIDISIAIIIFISAFVIVYIFIGANPNVKAGNLKDEAITIIKEIVSEESTIRIIDDNAVNVSKLNELKDLDYEELKRRLRIEGDFCIYIEDDDGNLVLIDNTYKGIGSSKIVIGGTPCSQK